MGIPLGNPLYVLGSLCSYGGPPDERKMLDSRSLHSACESPLEALLFRIRPAKYTVDGAWGGRLGYFALLAA
jgi:hypothetical protein